MDLATAATFFDTQPVTDAYLGVHLFDGQMDVYDLSKSDTAAGFRRTISAATIPAPARGCVSLGSEVFLMGRQTKDFFAGENHRTYAILHPADGLVEYGHPQTFLPSGSPTISAYSAETWLKDRKFEQESSELRPEYTHYIHPAEAISVGMIFKDTFGVYFRVQAVSRQTGGLLAVTAFDLGADALGTVSFVSSGAYDAVPDSLGASAPIAVSAFVEFFRANYHFKNNAALKYERSDKVVTVAATEVATPKQGDTLTYSGAIYRVLEVEDDGNSCWELHVRPEV